MAEPSTSPSRGDRYLSPYPWSEDRPQTLVICCSDGRWHLQIQDFIEQRVPGGVRADIYAIPGGPAGFNAMTSSLIEASSLEMAFRFMREQHRLRSVWLIAHDACAFYAHKKAGSSREELRRAQMDDLRMAASRIGTWFGDLDVTRVYAFRAERRVAFDLVTD